MILRNTRKVWAQSPVLLILIGFQTAETIAEERSLDFYHTHTERSLSLVYYKDGSYVTQALNTLSDFLKDFRNGEKKTIDPELLDLLFTLKVSTGTRSPFEIISCYRSPETNSMLRRRSSGVAKNSMHMHGKAIDIRLRDVDTETLWQTAIALKKGGVGLYRKSDFVHVDTGRVRDW